MLELESYKSSTYANASCVAMTKCFLLFFLVVVSILAATTKTYQRFNSNDTKAKIVAGSYAPEGAYPYQVSLRYKNSHSCGGSIIHNEWIITAAHCVNGISIQDLLVVAGSNNLDSGGTAYQITEAHVHELYISQLLLNDVALLKVKPITYTHKVQPIVLDGEEVGAGVPCVLSGWGHLYFQGSIPNNLQHIRLSTASNEFCRSHFFVPPVTETNICTFTQFGEGVCNGDSGGPLVRDVGGVFKQIGVVSFVRGCAVGSPDVFARMSSYINWFRATCNCF